MLHITHVYLNTATPNWRWPAFSTPAHVKKQFIFRRYKKLFDGYFSDGPFFVEKRNKDGDYYLPKAAQLAPERVITLRNVAHNTCLS
jgi:hypothetical protein